MRPEDLSPAEVAAAKRAASGDLGKVLARFPCQFAKAVIFYDPSPQSGEPLLNSATATLVDLGAGPLALTSLHVITRYRERLAEAPRMTMQIGDCSFDPLPRLRSSDAAVDLIAIGLDGLDLDSITNGEQIGGVFHTPRQWPPPPVREGDSVTVAGFPATLREPVAFRTRSFGSVSIGYNRVVSVSPAHFLVHFDRENWVEAFNNENTPLDDLRDFGGMSGSPVVMERLVNGVRVFDLVGIAAETPDANGMFCELLRVVSSSCVATDGAVVLPL